MGEAVSGLLRRRGKCAGKSRWISEISPELVFRSPDHQCSHSPNEISALGSELVFRQLPRELVQGGGQTQWFRRRGGLRRALVDPPCDGVAWVPPTPTSLGLPPARCLAFWLPAGLLALSYSRVRPEPLAADRTRSLPDLWHGDALWSPRVGAASVQDAWVSFGKYRWVTFRECRRR
jgi:hypothetical protein